MPQATRIASIQSLAEMLYAILDTNAAENDDLAREWGGTAGDSDWAKLRIGLEHLIANEIAIRADAALPDSSVEAN